MLSSGAVVELYVQRLLPLKLALDRVYIRHATILYDFRLIMRTVAVIVGRVLGTRQFPDPPELAEVNLSGALRHRSPASQPDTGTWGK
jgi:hypothetical protein